MTSSQLGSDAHKLILDQLWRKTPIPKPSFGQYPAWLSYAVRGCWHCGTPNRVVIWNYVHPRGIRFHPIIPSWSRMVARKLVDELFCRYSTITQLRSDQGRQLESKLLTELCKLLGIQNSRTTSCHPQCYSLVERCHAWNRTLQQSPSISVILITQKIGWVHPEDLHVTLKHY